MRSATIAATPTATTTSETAPSENAIHETIRVIGEHNIFTENNIYDLLKNAYQIFPFIGSKAKNKDGKTPLMHALLIKNKFVINWLFNTNLRTMSFTSERNCDCNAVDNNELSALAHAVSYRDRKNSKNLQSEEKNDDDANQKREYVELLIKNKCQITFSVLTEAISHGNFWFIQQHCQNVFEQFSDELQYTNIIKHTPSVAKKAAFQKTINLALETNDTEIAMELIECHCLKIWSLPSDYISTVTRNGRASDIKNKSKNLFLSELLLAACQAKTYPENIQEIINFCLNAGSSLAIILEEAWYTDRQRIRRMIVKIATNKNDTQMLEKTLADTSPAEKKFLIKHSYDSLFYAYDHHLLPTSQIYVFAKKLLALNETPDNVIKFIKFAALSNDFDFFKKVLNQSSFKYNDFYEMHFEYSNDPSISKDDSPIFTFMSAIRWIFANDVKETKKILETMNAEDKNDLLNLATKGCRIFNKCTTLLQEIIKPASFPPKTNPEQEPCPQIEGLSQPVTPSAPPIEYEEKEGAPTKISNTTFALFQPKEGNEMQMYQSILGTLKAFACTPGSPEDKNRNETIDWIEKHVLLIALKKRPDMCEQLKASIYEEPKSLKKSG